MKITMKKLIKETAGQSRFQLAGGKDKCFSVYVHALTTGYRDTDSRTEVARDRMTPSHAGNKATSQE